MFSRAILVLALVVCTVLKYCSAEGDITAYVKEMFPDPCTTVEAERSVCNVVWKVSRTAANQYDGHILQIRELIESKDIVAGLTASQAIDCRREYEAMLCGNYFPVCDSTKLTIDYGNGTARCERVNKACTTIFIDGCSVAQNDEQAIAPEGRNCGPLQLNTSNICHSEFNLKVPRTASSSHMGRLIKRLSETVDMFDEKTKNVSDFGECANNYREVLCRMITACSPDELYALFLIDKKECEDKMSCIEKHKPPIDVETTSMCTWMLDNPEKYIKVTVPNPFRVLKHVSAEPSPAGQTAGEKITTDKDEETTASPKHMEGTAGQEEPTKSTRTGEDVTGDIPTNSTLVDSSKKVAGSGKGSAGSIHFVLSVTTLLTTLPLLYCQLPW